MEERDGDHRRHQEGEDEQLQQQEPSSATAHQQQRKGLKRKLERQQDGEEEEDEGNPSASLLPSSAATAAMVIDIMKERVGISSEAHHHVSSPEALALEVRSQVLILNRCSYSWREPDRFAAKRATHVLAELAKNGMLGYLPIIIKRFL